MYLAQPVAMNTRALTLATLSLGLGLGTPSIARAMAPPPTPSATIRPTASLIPANLPGFGYTALEAKESDVQLTTGGGAVDVPLTVGPVVDGLLKITPSEPLEPGAAYRLEYNAFSNYAPFPHEPIEFKVADPAPLPTQLGELTAGPTVSLKDYGTTKATITASYALAEEMRPWAEVYELFVVLDGRPIETKPTFSDARDAVTVEAVAWCDEARAALSTHTIALRARLPFAEDVNTPSAEVPFTCPAPNIKPPQSQPPAPPAPAPEAPAAGAEDVGGGCAVSPSGARYAAGIALFFGLVASALRLRRRR